MHDNRADVDGRDIFFNLADFHTVRNSQLFGGCRCGMAILEIGITQTKERCMMAWVTSGAVGGGGTV